jgi:hypothetical protein
MQWTPFQLLQRLAEIIQELLIEEIQFAFRRRNGNKAGNAIDDQAKIEFAGTQGFLGALPVVNIRMQGTSG